MNSLDTDLQTLKARLQDGSIQRAYTGIVAFMSRLRGEFASQRGERAVSALYQGYFDMTYFALFPAALKQRDLKIAVVFNYATFGFEAWLAARNRKLQRAYWERLRQAGYAQHPLVEPAVGSDAIVTAVLASDYSIEAEDHLATRLVAGVEAFERDLIAFLDGLDDLYLPALKIFPQ